MRITWNVALDFGSLWQTRTLFWESTQSNISIDKLYAFKINEHSLFPYFCQFFFFFNKYKILFEIRTYLISLSDFFKSLIMINWRKKIYVLNSNNILFSLKNFNHKLKINLFILAKEFVNLNFLSNFIKKKKLPEIWEQRMFVHFKRFLQKKIRFTISSEYTQHCLFLYGTQYDSAIVLQYGRKKNR